MSEWFGRRSPWGCWSPARLHSVDSNSAAARPLVINPQSFVPIDSVEARQSVESRSRRLVHAGPRIMLYRPDDDSVFRANEPVTVHVEFLFPPPTEAHPTWRR